MATLRRKQRFYLNKTVVRVAFISLAGLTCTGANAQATVTSEASSRLNSEEPIQLRWKYTAVQPATSSASVRPLPAGYVEFLRKNGASEAEIEQAKKDRVADQNRVNAGTAREGVLVARRLGATVAFKMAQSRRRFGKEDWLEDKALYQDYSNGTVFTSFGPWGPRGTVAGDIDKAEGYRFPHTVGFTESPVFLCSLPIDYLFSKNDLLSTDSDGTAHYQKIVSVGPNRTQIIRCSLSAPGGEPINLEVHAKFRDTLLSRVVASGLKKVGELSLPAAVQITRYLANGDVQDSLSFSLISASRGKGIPVDDLKSLGPEGIAVQDHRLGDNLTASYKVGDSLKGETEIGGIARSAPAPRVEASSSRPILPYLEIAGGVLVVFGASLLFVRRRSG